MTAKSPPQMPVPKGYERLDQRALIFWRLSLGWNGMSPTVSTEKAFNILRDLTATTPKAQALSRMVDHLRECIICGHNINSRPEEDNRIRGKVINFVIFDELVPINQEQSNA